MAFDNCLFKSLTTAGNHAIDAAAEAKDVGVEKARKIAHDVDQGVHENPWLCIAGSAVCGLVLGITLHRCWHSPRPSYD